MLLLELDGVRKSEAVDWSDWIMVEVYPKKGRKKRKRKRKEWLQKRMNECCDQLSKLKKWSQKTPKKTNEKKKNKQTHQNKKIWRIKISKAMFAYDSSTVLI